MNQNEWIKSEKKKLARLKRSRCYICHKKFGKGFVFHHLYYSGDEPDFKADKYSYYAHVFKQVRDRPQQFALLCHAHHYFVEWAKRISDDKFRRFVRLRRLSK